MKIRIRIAQYNNKTNCHISQISMLSTKPQLLTYLFFVSNKFFTQFDCGRWHAQCVPKNTASCFGVFNCFKLIYRVVIKTTSRYMYPLRPNRSSNRKEISDLVF